MDLDLIRLVAQFVARNGKNFLTGAYPDQIHPSVSPCMRDDAVCVCLRARARMCVCLFVCLVWRGGEKTPVFNFNFMQTTHNLHHNFQVGQNRKSFMVWAKKRLKCMMWAKYSSAS